MTRRVAVVAGARTPFVKSGKQFREFGPLELASAAVMGLLSRVDIDSSRIDAISMGTVVPEPGVPNLARELVFQLNLANTIEAQTVSSYCISGLRSITHIADAITTGRINSGIAGGVESFSNSGPEIFLEPSTGLSMGQHMELTRRKWGISRKRQDEVAQASHRNAISAAASLAKEIVPTGGITTDSGPRENTSLEVLAALPPAFEPDGTITAGNASPVTDGASAVLLMSEEEAWRQNRTPLAFVKGIGFGAIDPADGLLMAPAKVVPDLLTRLGLSLEEIDLLEIHEAFAAQVIANAKAWEQGWLSDSPGQIDWDRINVSGSSIAIGHPWSATGGRIVTSLANEMYRRDSRYGLISICAAGGMAGAMVLER